MTSKPKWGQSRPILLVVAFLVAISSFNVFELLGMNGSLQVDVDKDEVKTAVPTLTEFLNQHSYTYYQQGAISAGGCCGIGHRLSRNIPVMVYAVSHNRVLYMQWNDVEWNVIINDTHQIEQGHKQKEHYGNGWPKNWNNSSLAKTWPMSTLEKPTAYDRYSGMMKELIEMPLAHSIIKLLSENLSSRVLSFLGSIRSQYASKHGGLHLCAHIREGNNETGDWKRKPWRNIDLDTTLNKTLTGMEEYVLSTASKTDNPEPRKKSPLQIWKNNKNSKPVVSVFVASDNEMARSRFEKNVPTNWHVVKPAKFIPKPKSGVWFGEMGSKTNNNLTQEQKDDAMAEAAADIFALGECDALYIPNYSTFNLIGIMLTHAERRPVYFLGKDGWINLSSSSD